MRSKNSIYFYHSRPEIQKLIPPKTKSLLDVGCSSGFFGEAIQDQISCRVVGIEPDYQAAMEAKKKLAYVFHTSVEEAFPLINETFDVITFNDVLEHLVDPGKILEASQRLLKPKGKIIASIPNILHYHEFLEILLKKDWKYQEAGIMDKTHLRFFTRKSILRLFDECGYNVLSIQGLDPTPSKKMTLISWLSFGYFNEMRYPQFAVIAEIKK